MLRADDLNLFQQYCREGQEPRSFEPRAPDDVLAVSEGGVTKGELWRLSRSLQVAAVAGLASEEAALAATLIHRRLAGNRYADLDSKDAWMEAVAWARKQPEIHEPPSWTERVQHVGAACARLLRKGFKIEVPAFGPYASERTVKEICSQIISLVRLVGGVSCAQQILRILKERSAVHDGFFVFGNRVSSLPGKHGPEYPWGWLFSLAVTSFSSPATARKPEVAWKTLIELAKDFAAVYDCQRYSQYEQLTHIPPDEFEKVLRDSITWRELFSLPQAPRLVVNKVGDALGVCITEEDETNLGFKAADLLREIQTLLAHSHDSEIKLFTPGPVKAAHPILRQVALGQKGKVNAGYKEPGDSHLRNHDRLLLFEIANGSVALLPRPLAANAACELMFRLMWSRLPSKRAAKITGEVLEIAIERACREKSPQFVGRDISYMRDNDRLQLDVGAREDGAVALFETKAKSLTAKARSGLIYSAFTDYADSFVAMLNQLVRHDLNLRQIGLGPLTSGQLSPGDLTVLKVAVSPLSFGPIMDRLLTANAMPAILGRSFGSRSAQHEDEKAIDDFNVATQVLWERLEKVAPTNSRGELDLFPYFINVYWLDLGQLLYALQRAPSVSAAFGPLKHLTFGSRDFWTEIAFADMQGLTATLDGDSQGNEERVRYLMGCEA